MGYHENFKDPFDDIYHPKSNIHRRSRKAQPPIGKAKPHIVRRLGEKPNVPVRLPVEVLEVIFGLLTQSSLRKGTSLVCKEWHRVTEQVISRVGTWKVSGMDYQDDLLERIRVGSVNTLECWFMLDPDVPGVQSRLVLPEHHAPMWDDFVDKITRPLANENISPGTLVREIAYLPNLGALKSVFSNLVYLEILVERMHHFSNIDQEFFDEALQRMPHLLHLYALAVPYKVGNIMLAHCTNYKRTEPRPIVGVKLPPVPRHFPMHWKKKFDRTDPAVITTIEPDLPPWTHPANDWLCTRLQTLSLSLLGQSLHIDFFYHKILPSFVHLIDLTLSQPNFLMGQLLAASENAN
ncbi:hypothetical protein BGZ59_000459, partial [Podila verticillata]